MKAVRFDEYGDVDVLKVVDVPKPAPGPGQVLVQVKAAGINPGEAKIRAGLLHARWPATFPSGQGSDLAGVVAETGTGATGFVLLGDQVIGYVDDNRASEAEYVVLPRDSKRACEGGGRAVGGPAGALSAAGATAYAWLSCCREADPNLPTPWAVSGAAGGVVPAGCRAGGQPAPWRDRDRPGGPGEPRAAGGVHGVIPVAYGDGPADRNRRRPGMSTRFHLTCSALMTSSWVWSWRGAVLDRHHRQVRRGCRVRSQGRGQRGRGQRERAGRAGRADRGR